MPWCDTCDRFYNPNSLRADGTCPICGRLAATAPASAAAVGSPAAVSTEADQVEERGAPWHFRVLIAVTAVYLGYRLFQGVLWVGHHL